MFLQDQLVKSLSWIIFPKQRVYPSEIIMGLSSPGIQTIQQPPKPRSFIKRMNQNTEKVKNPNNPAQSSTLLIIKPWILIGITFQTCSYPQINIFHTSICRLNINMALHSVSRGWKYLN